MFANRPLLSQHAPSCAPPTLPTRRAHKINQAKHPNGGNAAQIEVRPAGNEKQRIQYDSEIREHFLNPPLDEKSPVDDDRRAGHIGQKRGKAKTLRQTASQENHERGQQQ